MSVVTLQLFIAIFLKNDHVPLQKKQSWKDDKLIVFLPRNESIFVFITG